MQPVWLYPPVISSFSHDVPTRNTESSLLRRPGGGGAGVRGRLVPDPLDWILQPEGGGMDPQISTRANRDGGTQPTVAQSHDRKASRWAGPRSLGLGADSVVDYFALLLLLLLFVLRRLLLLSLSEPAACQHHFPARFWRTQSDKPAVYL